VGGVSLTVVGFGTGVLDMGNLWVVRALTGVRNIAHRTRIRVVPGAMVSGLVIVNRELMNIRLNQGILTVIPVSIIPKTLYI